MAQPIAAFNLLNVQNTGCVFSPLWWGSKSSHWNLSELLNTQFWNLWSDVYAFLWLVLGYRRVLWRLFIVNIIGFIKFYYIALRVMDHKNTSVLVIYFCMTGLVSFWACWVAWTSSLATKSHNVRLVVLDFASLRGAGVQSDKNLWQNSVGDAFLLKLQKTQYYCIYLM